MSVLFNMEFDLIWGCDPGRQYETHWIKHLLGPSNIQDVCAWNKHLNIQELNARHFPILVESGILHLERSPSSDHLSDVLLSRIERISLLQSLGHFGVIHISDEEGNDALTWYDYLPKSTSIWRNFSIPTLANCYPLVKSFPIGPRQLFIDSCANFESFKPASQRNYPWAFMGTLWPSGSRLLASSLFLRSLPTGCFYSGPSFGMGLPLATYRQNLFDSIFALSPEGDRHLDTFRLWEILSCGSIPLVVDFQDCGHVLLPCSYPVPIFSSWSEALNYAQCLLDDSNALDNLQSRVYGWWLDYQASLSHQITSDFYAEH